MSDTRSKFDTKKSDCEFKLKLATAKSHEACRYTDYLSGLSGGLQADYLWSKAACKAASKEVLDLVEECSQPTLKK